MVRPGFIGRLMLILAAALLAMIAINVGITHLAQRDRVSQPARRFPRVVQAAGLIDLIRKAPPALQTKIAALGESGIVHVDIVGVPPATAPHDIAAPHLAERLLQVLASPAPGLQVFTNERMKHPPENHSAYEGQLTKALMPLDAQRTLVIEWRDPPRFVFFTLFGLPPALWTAILGFAVALLAVLGAAREMRPLRRLADEVSRFDGSAPPPAFDEAGAPDVRRLVRAVRDMQQRVATLLGERSFLVGAISHDLRIYLTRLRLRAEAMPDPEARARLIGDLDGMASLIDTSLAFARATVRADKASRIDLGDLVAIEVEERAALGPRVRLESRYADEAIIAGDPVALRRVVANVLDNALKFAREVVTVRVERAPAREHIVIEDDGPGIPTAQRRRVFDPFFCADARGAGGSGLGLAIARQIVEAHGGTIEVLEAPGAAVLIALPPWRG